MTIQDYFSRYSGQFIDVKLKGSTSFKKMVFYFLKYETSNGKRIPSFIDADLVPNNDEEEYLSKYISNRKGIKQIPISEGQIEEVRPGRRLPVTIPAPEE
jgi:hypothetical protein